MKNSKKCINLKKFLFYQFQNLVTLLASSHTNDASINHQQYHPINVTTMTDNCSDFSGQKKAEITGRATARTLFRQQNNRQHTVSDFLSEIIFLL